MTEEVIATKDVVVHDDNMGIDRKVFAGQPVPPDLVDAYFEATGEGTRTQAAADAEAKRAAEGGGSAKASGEQRKSTRSDK
jgi:hypothetical protein